MGGSAHPESVSDRPREINMKSTPTANPDFSEDHIDSSSEKATKDTQARVQGISNVEITMKLPEAGGLIVDLHDHPVGDMRSKQDSCRNENISLLEENLISRGGRINNESQKYSCRRVSLPEQNDYHPNGVLITERVPSYMATTESFP